MIYQRRPAFNNSQQQGEVPQGIFFSIGINTTFPELIVPKKSYRAVLIAHVNCIIPKGILYIKIFKKKISLAHNAYYVLFRQCIDSKFHLCNIHVTGRK